MYEEYDTFEKRWLMICHSFRCIKSIWKSSTRSEFRHRITNAPYVELVNKINYNRSNYNRREKQKEKQEQILAQQRLLQQRGLTPPNSDCAYEVDATVSEHAAPPPSSPAVPVARLKRTREDFGDIYDQEREGRPGKRARGA
jgi:hypothetical protein